MAERDQEGGDSRGVRFTKAGFAAVAALVLLVGNIGQLAWNLNPSWKPDPNERLRAAIEPVSAEPDISLATYLRRTTAARDLAQAVDDRTRSQFGGKPPSHEAFLCAKARALSVRGYMVYANVTVEGLKHRAVDLYTSLYSEATRRRLATYEDEAPLPPLKLTSPTDSFVQAAFLTVPARPRALYRARFELRTHTDDGGLGTLLAMADSRPFPGFEAHYPQTYPHCSRS